MLYTAGISVPAKIDKKMQRYYLMKDQGNDVVCPDWLDLDQYRSGGITWQGFRVNYMVKLMEPEAEEWMKRISAIAVNADVVLVSDEEDAEHRYRVLLAERMLNMFSGQMKVRYMGELKV